MSCDKIEPWISAYIDGELDAQQSLIVEAHLASCPACQAVADDFRRIGADLAEAGRVKPSMSLLHRVKQKLAEAAKEQPPARERKSGSAFAWQRTAASVSKNRGQSCPLARTNCC